MVNKILYLKNNNTTLVINLKRYIYNLSELNKNTIVRNDNGDIVYINIIGNLISENIEDYQNNFRDIKDNFKKIKLNDTIDKIEVYYDQTLIIIYGINILKRISITNNFYNLNKIRVVCGQSKNPIITNNIEGKANIRKYKIKNINQKLDTNKDLHDQ